MGRLGVGGIVVLCMWGPDLEVVVVPAQAGTHTPRQFLLERKDNDQRAKQ